MNVHERILGKFLLISLCLGMILSFTGCSEEPDRKNENASLEVQNLEKLCKVWGYTKYTHPAFLLGEKDWDEELLNLIPVVSEAKEKEVNDILHEWFVSLGEIDYKTSRTRTLPPEDELIVQADTSWISDKKYLGKELVADLSQFKEIPNVDKSRAPMNVDTRKAPQNDMIRMYPTFTNEKYYENMDYNDSRYCLLGLFRLWNTMEYYYPYLDILDANWHDLLPEYIEKMLAEPGRKNYELTLAMLGAKLQDPHVIFFDSNLDIMPSVKEIFGEYGAPVFLSTAEGKLVVSQVLDNTSLFRVFNGICPLQAGDIICKVEGKDIEDVIEDGKKYIAVPTDDKIINVLSPFLLRSHNENFEVTVLRDGKEETVTVKGQKAFRQTVAYAAVSHELLEGNIGLINPCMLQKNEIFSIMQEFKDTDGLIIDLRQYPYGDPACISIPTDLAEYLVEKHQTFILKYIPVQTIQGVFAKTELSSGDILPQRKAEGVYYYDKNVVVLINEQTQSAAEYTTLAVRNGEKVTIMGENSVGTIGEVKSIPLPGGFEMSFSSMGVYTPDGGQTQRVGLTPDIEVHPTIEGIKEGRDELMEAAVAYIQEQNKK